MTLRKLGAGALSGLTGGIVSGMILHSLWLLTPLGLFLGQASPGRGMIVHLALSALIGVAYAAFLNRSDSRVGWNPVSGLLTGMLYWVLGPLFLVPLALGLPPQFTLMGKWLSVLLAYLFYGLTLSATHYLVSERINRREPSK